MTKEQLQDRISKKEQDIAKIEKRITKWSKGLRPEDIAICEPFGNCYYGTAPRNMSWRDYHGTPEYQEASRNYKNYLDTHDDIPSSKDWNKGPSIGELSLAYRDLGEANHTLDKYKNELKNLEKFDSEDKVEIIWNFLQDWKRRSSEYYHKEVERYNNLQNNYDKEWNKYKNTITYEDSFNYYKSRNWSDWRASYEIELRFRKNYYDSIDALTKEISGYNGSVDEEKLNKVLDKEVRVKYERLVQEVTEKAGEIIDASNLRIDVKGEISGLIKGTKNNVELWATVSGGEIQIVHIRSYVRVRQ